MASCFTQGWGGGRSLACTRSFHPHPSLPPSRGKERFARIISQLHMQPRIGGIEEAVEFLLRAGWVIAQLLHLVSRLRPDALQLHAALAEQFFAAARNLDHAVLV